MGIPTLPKELHRPSLDETIIDLMESIAKEELALSHLVTSESNKIKAFIGKELDFPTYPTTAEILTFNYSVNKLMDTVLMKEWLLLKKLETVSHIKNTLTTQGNSCKCHHGSCEEEEYMMTTNHHCSDDEDEQFFCNENDEKGDCHE